LVGQDGQQQSKLHSPGLLTVQEKASASEIGLSLISSALGHPMTICCIVENLVFVPGSWHKAATTLRIS
jgi:hypothetical protein